MLLLILVAYTQPLIFNYTPNVRIESADYFATADLCITSGNCDVKNFKDSVLPNSRGHHSHWRLHK